MTVTKSLRDDLEKGDVVEYSYKPEDAEDPTEEVTHTGTVCKSNRGGIRVLPDGDNSHVRRMHVIKAGKVQSKHKDGGAARLSRTLGSIQEVQQTGETAGVTYKQGTGWLHTEEDSS